MKREIISKIISGLLIIIGLYYVWLKTPLCSSYFYDKAKDLYNKGQYNQSVNVFERSLLANPKNSAARFMYVQALSKSVPDYYVQESLYKMANSTTQDSANEYAKNYVIQLKRQLLDGLEDNYIYNAMLNKDLIRWNIESFPLKVYIEKSKEVPDYYEKNIKDALLQWMKSVSFLKFVESSDSEKSDIVINFEPYSGDNCKNGLCKYIVATTYPNIDKHHRLVRMNMTFYKTNHSNEPYLPEEIYNNALHEIGHALGIMGHSDNSRDIMYTATNSDIFDIFGIRNYRKNLSLRDVNTMTLLYRIAPTVTNIRGWYHDDLYYAPLILGNEDEIMLKKLEELEKYISQYPDFATGYINISSVYSNLGRSEDAFSALDSAEKLAHSENEKYLVEFNRAVLYYNKQNFNKALEYAQKAQAIKPNEGIAGLIEDIEKFLENNR